MKTPYNFTPMKNPWCVMKGNDTKTQMFMSYLTEQHARQLMFLMNDVEAESVNRCGGKWVFGESTTYYAKPLEHRAK